MCSRLDMMSNKIQWPSQFPGEGQPGKISVYVMSLLMFLKVDSWFSRAAVIYRLPELRSTVASVICPLAVIIKSSFIRATAAIH